MHKKRVTVAAFWSVLEQFLSKTVHVLTTFILAYFLVPADYALLAMLALFISLGATLVDGGFSQALIRKKEVVETDLNTIFGLNIGLALGVYIVLYISAPFISSFYSESRLTDLVRVVSVAVFFQALVVVPRVVLIRSLGFKRQVRVLLPAALLSSIVAVVFGAFGCGVWALIAQILCIHIISFFLYFNETKWRPKLYFSMDSVRSLWSFSKYTVLDSLLAIPFKNMYLIILPKFFSNSLVGAYFFAEKIRDTLLNLFVSSIQSVAYPALSTVQKEHVTLYRSHQKIMILTTFVVFPLMLVLALLTPLIFRVLLPANWSVAAEYLQWMFLASTFFPLHALNLNILKVKGRAKLVFYITLYKRAVNVLLFIITIDYGIIGVIYGQCLLTIMHLAPHFYFSEKTIGYPIGRQIRDVLPSLFCSLFACIFIFCVETLFTLSEKLEAILLVIIFAGVYMLTSRLVNGRAFNLFRGVIDTLIDKKGVQ